MSAVKIAGGCTLCNARCFEVMQVFEDHERTPGEPKRLGKPDDDAKRISFLLYDGTQMNLTFCAECDPQPEQFTEIWRKVMRSWQREVGNAMPEWLYKQFGNGILRAAKVTPWKEVMNG